MIFVDDDSWGAGDEISGRTRIPFLEKGGKYWGPSPDDETAISELERLREEGARFRVFVWSAFWWLAHFPRFSQHVESRYSYVFRNGGVIIFDLRISS